MSNRVQIPAYTDRWMMGDRFGEMVKTTIKTIEGKKTEIAHVKLDKSGKTLKFILNDCNPV